jgi:hypothetical protein
MEEIIDVIDEYKNKCVICKKKNLKKGYHRCSGFCTHEIQEIYQNYFIEKETENTFCQECKEKHFKKCKLCKKKYCPFCLDIFLKKSVLITDKNLYFCYTSCHDDASNNFKNVAKKKVGLINQDDK